ncbi:hypothetical protein AQPE_2508 [Aquipluma nitroreducens]|uniref:Uncharacterized protein n=1 Tax=Aquipluma nitroreducens TaxID=2010828 RepID=A0A5K7SA52_9BACT|nr:hypothetical protein AQPE_2508 [Aquipluma nitroreducens]
MKLSLRIETGFAVDVPVVALSAVSYMVSDTGFSRTVLLGAGTENTLVSAEVSVCGA